MIDDNIGITVHEQCADSKFLLQITFLEDRYILSNNKFRQHKEYSTNWVNQHRFDYIIIRDKINCSRKSFITSNDKLKNSLPENLLIDKVEVHI